MGSTPRAGVRAAVFVAWLAALAVAGRALPDLDSLRAWVEAAGPAAPLVFVAGYVAAALMFVPRPVLNAAAGVVFAAWPGIAVALAAGVVSALVQFGFARVLVRDLVAARLPDGVAARLEGLTGRHGLLTVVQLRLLPVVPFAVVNYGLGLTSLRIAPFVLGTALGGLPATAALVVLGDTATDPMSPAFMVSVALLAVLVVASQLAAIRVRRRPRGRGRRPPGSAQAVGPGPDAAVGVGTRAAVSAAVDRGQATPTDGAEPREPA